MSMNPFKKNKYQSKNDAGAEKYEPKHRKDKHVVPDPEAWAANGWIPQDPRDRYQENQGGGFFFLGGGGFF